VASLSLTPVAIRKGDSGHTAPTRPGIDPVSATALPVPPAGEDFTAVVSAASAMFGDPTRRRIYLLARDTTGGVTAAQAAASCELHPNVARHHLDKLVAGGYLEVGSDAQEGKSGRPSKRYRTTGKPIELEFGARRHDLVTTLLAKALDMLPPDVAQRMAEEVGEQYGRELATQMNPGDQHRSKRAALHAVADALTAHGFAAHAVSSSEVADDSMSLVRGHCPFGELSETHPVICAVDRGMVRGMLHELYGDSELLQSLSRPQGDDVCASTH
jgi:predicted ArsR family transcriptional regulator